MLIILSFATENDKLKFEYVYNKYKKLMLYKAYDVLKNYSLAEDAASEAFIRVYRNLHKIDDPDSNRTVAFLVTIVKNVSITMLTRQKNNSSVDIDEFEAESDFNLEEFVISEAMSESILNLLDELKEELRTIFILKYAYSMSHKEISGVLNISENNVTVRLHRAKQKLIQLLEREGYIHEKQ